MSKIRNSPIHPKCEVQHLLFIWDWKKFIIPHFTDKMLANHSHYHAFQVKRDGDGKVSLRAKKYPQDKSWFPANGLKLVKDGTVYDPVDVAQFRAEDLNLDKVMSDLRSKYFPLVSETEKKKVISSWEKLSTTLIQMPKKCLPKMKLQDIEKQKSAPVEFDPPGYLVEHIEPDSHPELTGEPHPSVEAVDMEFKTDVRVGVDVVLWTHEKRTRPWVGRVHKIVSSEEFILQWYERQSQSHTFLASKNEDGTPFLRRQPMTSVMFWQMSVKPTKHSFDLPEYELKRIMHEYESHDQCYSEHT